MTPRRLASRRESRHGTGLAVVALGLAVLVGCGGSDGAGGSGAEEDDGGAAEPARSPALTAEPAGTVVEVAPLPQGIVHDARTDLLAVSVREEYRLLLLDPTTLEEVGSVPLPGKARHLQVARPGGPVLVPSESADQLVEVSLPSGTLRATDVGDYPHDAAGAANGDIVVGNEFEGSLSLVRDGETVDTVADLTQPGSVVIAGRTVAVVDVEDWEISTYDLRTLDRTGRVAAGAGPTHAVALSGGRFAVADTRGDQLLVFDTAPLRQVGALDVGDSPYGLASDPASDLVWVTLTASNELVGVDVSSDEPRAVDTYPTVRQPNTVAVAPGSGTVWVAGTADGVVQRITR